jgi:2-desacetyl-2-hydroxyethyl bacteriochlorophyllide A dehydrogenase
MNNERTMLALRKPGACPGVALSRVPLPQAPGEGEVLVEVAAAGVCGSDLHIDEWTSAYAFLAPHLPVTLGHEFSGRVSAVGPGVGAWRIGDPVAVKPSSPCGACPACLADRADACARRSALGLHADGGFAPYVRCPQSQLLRLPEALDPVLGALAEPLAVSGAAVVAGGVREGDRVLVLGPGTIGQGAALLARRAGAAQVVVAGVNDAPRFGVLRAMGFGQLVDLGTPEGEAELAQLAGEGFDIVIEAAGAEGAVRTGLKSLRIKGVMVAVGIHASPPRTDLTLVARRQLQIRGSSRGSHAVWVDVVTALAEQPDLYRHMVTHTLPLNRAAEAFEIGHRREASKVLLLPGASA